MFAFAGIVLRAGAAVRVARKSNGLRRRREGQVMIGVRYERRHQQRAHRQEGDTALHLSDRCP